MDESFFIILINFIIITLGSPYLVYHRESNIKRFKTIVRVQVHTNNRPIGPKQSSKRRKKESKKVFFFFLAVNEILFMF